MPSLDHLETVAIPERYDASFSFLQGVPVYFFSVVTKVNRLFFTNTRVCVLTDYSLSLASTKGKILRCCKVEDIASVALSGDGRAVGVRMRDRPYSVRDDPFRQTSFFEMPVDTLMEFGDATVAREFVRRLAAVRAAYVPEELPTETARSGEKLADLLSLAPNGSRTKQTTHLKKTREQQRRDSELEQVTQPPGAPPLTPPLPLQQPHPPRGESDVLVGATTGASPPRNQARQPPPLCARCSRSCDAADSERGDGTDEAGRLRRQLEEAEAALREVRRYNYSCRCELDDLKRALVWQPAWSGDGRSRQRGHREVGSDSDDSEPEAKGLPARNSARNRRSAAPLLASSSSRAPALLRLEQTMWRRYEELPPWLQVELQRQRYGGDVESHRGTRRSSAAEARGGGSRPERPATSGSGASLDDGDDGGGAEPDGLTETERRSAAGPPASTYGPQIESLCTALQVKEEELQQLRLRLAAAEGQLEARPAQPAPRWQSLQGSRHSRQYSEV